MKKVIAVLLGILMLFSVCACAGAPAEPEVLTPLDRAEAFLKEKIENNTLLSFDYDGGKYAEIIKKWEKKVETAEENGVKTTTVTYTSPEQVVLTVTAKINSKTAALDYVASFENKGSGDSPVISDILAIDTEYVLDNAALTTARGCIRDEYDFEPIFVDLAKESPYTVKNDGGRSTDAAWPYFDICNGSEGILGAIGWTGTWGASFTKTDAGVRIAAGLQETRISLHKDEKMRTPSIVLLFFDGDQDTGHNLFRDLIRTDYCPDSITGLPVCLSLSTNISYSSAMSTFNLADRLERRYEAMWLDAGWYGDEASWATQVGNWYVNKKTWPNGLKPLVDAVHEAGKEMIVWFEPERAVRGTELPTEHPEWFIDNGINNNLLLNLGIDEACDYMIDLVSGVLIENGIDWYRQDFNMAPAEYWRAADKADGENRVGMTEIKHITNLYRYIDALYEKIPGLKMDNCAAGGRRLDIEMMKRSAPLLRDDYTVNMGGSVADGVRAINYNLSWWLPMHAGNRAADGMNTSYQFRSMMSAGLCIGAVSTGTNNKWFTRMIDEYYECRELMGADYYVLGAGYGREYKKINACYEYYDPAKNAGCLLAFCPMNATELTQTFLLKGLTADASYTLNVRDTGDTVTLTGEELMSKGLEVRFTQPSESLLIFFSVN